MILVPFGGGGLISGIALVCMHWGSRAQMYACETEAAAPFYSSLAAAGHPYFAGKRIAAVLTGGGIDMRVLASVLNGERSGYLMPSRIRDYE
ncbi:hypothetical protein [Paraburkholderia haematera]|uniref:hypothetical protein n=1 Tax=Paraburkholderia haematera TaxID=2793077 RepID=UPI001F33DC51|nr:hypothetical protein [Paraburkholderia haematera]